MQEKKTTSFISGAAILMAANLLVKVIGLAFKVPLTYLIGEDGMGHFSDAYTMYTWMFVLATAGLPVAISKMVSESSALGNTTELRRIFRVSVLTLSLLGIIGTAVLYWGADSFASLIGNPKAAAGIRAIAPAMFFVAIMSAFRGFFQGRQNMTPTAVSEVSEALGKLVIGYLLAYLLLPRGLEIAAAGAVAGVTGGAFLGAVVLFLLFSIKRRSFFPKTTSAADARTSGALFRRLIGIAVPITIGASVFSLTTVIDMAMIKRSLLSAGFSPEAAVRLWGSYSGYAVPIFNMPPTLLTAISISLVPAVASSYISGRKEHAKESVKSAIRITTLFALPCSAGVALLAEPILYGIYDNINAAPMLSILGWAIVFVSLVQVTNAILQAVGKVYLPVLHMVLGGIVKIIINHALVSSPAINICGAPIGTIVCYALILILNLFAIRRAVGVRYNLSDMLLKPLFATLIMGGVTLLVYRFCIPLGRVINLVPPILAAIFTYFILLFSLRAVKEADIRLLPKGDTLVRLLKRSKLLK